MATTSITLSKSGVSPGQVASAIVMMEDIHHGLLGEVIDVDTTTVNTLFVVEGAEEEELLVPAQEEFIVGIDQKQKLITVELPEGLLNLEELEDDR